jgi:hypothetical protein
MAAVCLRKGKLYPVMEEAILRGYRSRWPAPFVHEMGLPAVREIGEEFVVALQHLGLCRLESLPETCLSHALAGQEELTVTPVYLMPARRIARKKACKAPCIPAAPPCSRYTLFRIVQAQATHHSDACSYRRTNMYCRRAQMLPRSVRSRPLSISAVRKNARIHWSI